MSDSFKKNNCVELTEDLPGSLDVGDQGRVEDIKKLGSFTIVSVQYDKIPSSFIPTPADYLKKIETTSIQPVDRIVRLSSSASTYNQNAYGRIWVLNDLPLEWNGEDLLRGYDVNCDDALEESELDQVDWLAFTDAVRDFQSQIQELTEDGKLGPKTLRKLHENYPSPVQNSGNGILQLGDMTFHKPSKRISPPNHPVHIANGLREKRIQRLWNNYGKQIAENSKEYGIQTEAALAVFSVESGNAYSSETDLVILRYEPHKFRKYTGVEVSINRGGQRQEWKALKQAFEISEVSALKSCSYGLPQLMGFNFKVTPYNDVKKMVLAFQDSCEAQVDGFFQFVKENNLLNAIKNQDWRLFTSRYNGSGNVDVYSSRIIRELKVIREMKDDGAVFTD